MPAFPEMHALGASSPCPAGARRLRIVHADTDDIENPLRGGQPVRTYAVNSRLAPRHDITVLTSVYRGCRRTLVRNGVNYRRLGLRLPGFGLSPHLSFLACLGPALKIIPHDLVVEDFAPPVGFCGTPWWTNQPVVLEVQWYFFDQWEKRYHLPFSRWMRRLARTGRYRYVIVQSRAMARELQPLLPEAEFRHIPCGLDEAAYATEVTGGDCVLFLGRIDIDHKGLDLLLAAWREVGGPAQIPLVIAGEGPARPALEAAFGRAGLGSLVQFVGRIEGAAKQAALRRARLVVVPSRYETFGIAALEAMAAGKPVVCFNIDHLNEVAAPPWARHVAPFDATALGHAVNELWRDPARCQAMGAAALRQARHYHWDEIARQQEEFYLEITSHPTNSQQ